MTTYTTGNTLLTGASDPNSDTITVRRINGSVPGSWPHTVALTIGSAIVTEAGAVTYDDGGNTAPHPGASASKTAGTFTFTLWDGQAESPTYTATVSLTGASGGGGGASLVYGQDSPVGPTSGSLYVDAAIGASGNGLTLGAAKKTIQEAVNIATAGQTIVVKGGTYRETVTMPTSGTSGSPITLTRYGSEEPVISAFEPLTGWTACTDQADAGGNPNWANIYKCFVPSAVVSAVQPLGYNLRQAGVPMYLVCAGQGVVTNDDMLGYRDYTFMTVAGTSGLSFSTTGITDPGSNFLDRYTSNTDLNEAYIAAYVGPDSQANIRKITAYNATTQAITHNALGQNYNSGGTLGTRYMIINCALDIVRAGLWAFKDTTEADGTRKVWCWPHNPAQMAQIEISRRGYGIDTNGRDFLTFYGLTIEGGTKPDGFSYSGSGIINAQTSSNPSTNITVDQCLIRHLDNADLAGFPGAGAVFFSGGGSSITVRRTSILHCRFVRGVTLEGVTGSLTEDCRIDRIGSNAVHIYGNSFGGAELDVNAIVAFNHISEVRGTHANTAVTGYAGARNMLIFGNKVTGRHTSFWSVRGTNIWIINNDFVTSVDEVYGNRPIAYTSSDAGSQAAGVCVAMNNTIHPHPNATLAGATECFGGWGGLANQTHSLVGNVFHGGGSSANGAARYNLLTGITNGQGSYASPAFASGSSLLAGTGNGFNTSLAAVYADHANGDHRPKAGGPLVGRVAADFSGLLPTGAWVAGFDMNRDAAGNAMTWGAGIAAGAYQETV